MRWGYVLGPLALLPVLGGLLLAPQPGDDGRLRFDRASLALLDCHIEAAAFFVFSEDASPAPSAPRVER